MNCKAIIFLKSAMAGMLLVQSLSATAKCGGVDYSWGADALATAHNDVVTMIFYVFYLIYAVSSIVAVIGVILRFSQFLYCFHNARK
ncbi:MAG: DUF4134 family protein [Prevotella sp.]|nr:DUF4134 family protein [Prevotella sp.]